MAEEDTVVNFPTVRMKRRMPIWVKKREDYKLTKIIEPLDESNYFGQRPKKLP